MVEITTESVADGHPDAPSPAAPSKLGIAVRGAAFLFFVWFTGMCAYALMLWHDDQAEFEANAVRTEGLVIDEHIELLSGGGGRTTSDPEVAFVTADGDTIVFRDTSAIDLGVSIGDRVDVLYHPDQPEWARIDNVAQSTNSTAITLVLGVLTVVSGTCAYFAARGVVRAIGRRQDAAILGPPG